MRGWTPTNAPASSSKRASMPMVLCRVLTRGLLPAIAALTAALVWQPVITFAQSSDAEELQELFEGYLDDEELSGGVLLVASHDERYVVAAGFADRRTGERVTPDTRFYIASTGKMMVASAILAAVDEGRIALDQTVEGFVSDIEYADQLLDAGPVTVEQLLNHSSGLSEYLTDTFLDASFIAPETRWTAAEALAYALDEPGMSAGRRFDYTNTNYVILGHILARLDGSLAESLQRWVFRRAGMMASTVGAPPDPGSLFARGYDYEGTDVSAIGWNSVLGDGPVITTIGDLESFARALFESQRIVSNSTRDDMVAPSALEASYGLGVGLEDDGIARWYGHEGSYDGFEAELRYYPDYALVLAYMVNGNQLSDASVLDEAAAWFFDE